MRQESGIFGWIYTLLEIIGLVTEREPEATDEGMELYEEELDELEALVDEKYGGEDGVKTEVGDDAVGWGLAGSEDEPGNRAGSDTPFKWKER